MRIKTAGKILAIIITLSVVISLAVPLLSKTLLKNWLLDNGAEQVTVEGLYLNLWTGRLRLQGLEASATDKPALRIGHLETDVSYQALWKKRLQVNELQFFDSELPIQQVGEQWLLGPVTLVAAPLPATAGTADSKTAPSAGSGWHWGLSEFSLKGINVVATIEQSTQRLNIESGLLRLLYDWVPGQDSFLQLKGHLNDSDFNLDSRGTPLAEQAAGQIAIKINQLALAPLLKPWLPEFQGLLSSDLKLEIRSQPSGLSVSQNGTLELQTLQLTQPTLEVAAQSVTWSGDAEAGLTAKGIQSISTQGRLRLAGPKMKQAELDISSQQLDWQGSNKLQLLEGQLQRLDNQGQLTVAPLTLSQPSMQLSTQAINWNGSHRLAFDGGAPTAVDSDGQLLLDSLALAAEALQLKTKALSWQGNNQLKLRDSRPASIATKGKLSLSQVTVEQPQQQLSTDKIDWNGSNQLTFVGEVISQLLNQGELGISQLTLQQPDVRLSEQQLEWSGSLDTDLSERLSVAGTLATQPSSYSLKTLKLNTSKRRWQGEAELDLQSTELTRLTGFLNLSQLQLTDAADLELASVAEIGVEKLSALSGNRVKLSGLGIQTLTLSNQNPLFSLDSLSIDQLQLGPQEALIESLSLGAIKSELSLDKQGKPQAWLDWQAKLTGPVVTPETTTAEAEKTSPAGEKSPADASPFHFAAQQVQLNQPALLSFNDESVNARAIEIAIDSLKLNNIDSQNDKASPFAIAANINRFGKLAIDGNYSLMAATPSGDWKGTLSNLELPPFSPYMQRHSGYQVKNGQISVKSSGKIDQGQVDSKNRININNLQVKLAKKSASTEFDKQLGMPLETAISILTDDDNNVVLDIPVKGSVDDPQFGYQSVVKIIMTKVAKEGAISYLSTALQPYGALISLGRMLADSAAKNAINLQPVEFAPGSAELDAKALDYLSKIGDLLRQRDGLRLNLCGFAVAADKEALTQAFRQQQLQLQQQGPQPLASAAASVAAPAVSVAGPAATTAPPTMDSQQLAESLNSLAEQRSEAVKTQLLAQDKVSPERLFSCLPEVRLESDLAPSVSLGL